MGSSERLFESYVSTHTAGKYGPASVELVRRRFHAWDREYLPLLPSDREATMLDAGCGDGSFLAWLAARGFSAAEGVDLSREQIDRAHSMGIMGVRQGDLVQELERASAAYQVIIARDVLEHVRREDVIPLLEKARAALQPGGRLVGQLPNAENLLWGRIRHGDFTHEQSFTRLSLLQVLREAGFVEIETYSQPPVPHGIRSTVRALLWKAIESLLRSYLLIENGRVDAILTPNLIFSARAPG